MSIERIGSGLVRPFTPPDPHTAKGSADDESPSEHSVGRMRSDSLELSEQGLARAAEISEKEGMTADRETEIRIRLAEAFYDEPSVAREVVRRLISSGDLQGDS